MTPKQAAEILREHNAWRRGEGKYESEGAPVPMPHSPKELGQAIDEAIGALEHLAGGEGGVAWDDPTPLSSDGADIIISSIYRKFKEWSKRGFSADDVSWCEVKAEVIQLIRLEFDKFHKEMTK